MGTNQGQEQKKYIYIYIITNSINDKKYIGLHSTNNLNDNYMGGGTALKNAQKKYGRINFHKEILLFCDTVDIAYLKEAEYINKYNTIRPSGYNISPSGEPARHGGVSVETRAKMSKKQKVIQAKPEQKKRKSILMKEKWSDPLYKERVLSKRKETNKNPVVKQRRSEIFKQWWSIPENKNNAIKNMLATKDKKRGMTCEEASTCPYCGHKYKNTYLCRTHRVKCKEKPVFDYNECLWGHISQLKPAI